MAGPAWQGGMHGGGGDVHGRGCVCGRAACMAGGHAWQRSMCGQGGVHGQGVCMAGGHAWHGCGVHGQGCARFTEILSKLTKTRS